MRRPPTANGYTERELVEWETHAKHALRARLITWLQWRVARQFPRIARSNPGGRISPSYDTLSRDADCERKAAMETVGRLCRLGLLSKSRRTARITDSLGRTFERQTTNDYVLLMPDRPLPQREHRRAWISLWWQRRRDQRRQRRQESEQGPGTCQDSTKSDSTTVRGPQAPARTVAEQLAALGVQPKPGWMHRAAAAVTRQPGLWDAYGGPVYGSGGAK